MAEEEIQNDIAIIGMTGRFPGAESISQFWQNLCKGVESIEFFSIEEARAFGVSEEELQAPNYVRAKGVLANVEYFDAGFFEIPYLQAKLTDPQHRIALECAWEALENSGYYAEEQAGKIAVYVGQNLINTYYQKCLANNAALKNLIGLSEIDLQVTNLPDHLPGILSYHLNFTGPTVLVQAACATSLYAVNMAAQCLLDYQCDMALAGGVSINLPIKTGHLYQAGHPFSPDGHIRTFDVDGQGMTGGDGVGFVVLKRLADALKDKDHVYAVIKGTALNNDGAMRVGFAAPSAAGQAKVIEEALEVAGVSAETIGYVEAHGTATQIGDPIEVSALTQVYRNYSEKKQYVAIGSVKTNVGHLNTAAGVTGLIKATLAIYHNQIPPSLHFNKPNPALDLPNSPFYVNTSLSAWPTDKKRRAGVSSFGAGGFNAHTILEEAPLAATVRNEKTQDDWNLIVLSAKTPSALQKMQDNLAELIQADMNINMANIAYTSQVGRASFNHRLAFSCHNNKDAIAILKEQETERLFKYKYNGADQPAVVFMFPGQGVEYVGVAKNLYLKHSIFREQIDYCAAVLKPLLNLDIRAIIYPELFPQNDNSLNTQNPADLLKNLQIGQPVLLSIEFALAKLWLSWGIKPQAMIGQSLGEYAAASIAGVLKIEDALSIVMNRGHLAQTLPTSAMLAVFLSVDDMQVYLNNELSIAAISSPKHLIVSGSHEAIRSLIKILDTKEIEHRLLNISHAGHSHLLDPILNDIRPLLDKIKFSKPEIPYISNLTGTWIDPEQVISPEYWIQHTRNTVNFSAGINQLLKANYSMFLEVGPGRTLSNFAKSHKPIGELRIIALSSLPTSKDTQTDQEIILQTLGRLWLHGIKPDWSAVNKERQVNKCPLPSYPFERKRYWIEPTKLNFTQTDQINDLEFFDNIDNNTSESHTKAEAEQLTTVEQKLLKIWGLYFDAEILNLNSNYFELGGDSLFATLFISRIAKAFNLKLTPNFMLAAPTIAKQAKFIEVLKNKPEIPSCIIPLKLIDNNLPSLFLIHPAGGNIFHFRHLLAKIKTQCSIYGIQAANFEGDDVRYMSVEELATTYVKAIRVIQPEGPYYLLGFSFGGTVACEMVRNFSKHKQQVKLLGMIDVMHENVFTQLYQAADLNAIETLCSIKTVADFKNIKQLNSSSEHMQHFLQQIKDNVNMLTQETFETLQKQVLAYKLHIEAALAYKLKPLKMQPSKVIYFSVEQQEQSILSKAEWEKFFGDKVASYEISGNHFSILEEPGVHVICKALEDSLV